MTGCFDAEHLRGELKGIERMYIPIEDEDDQEGEDVGGDGGSGKRMSSGDRKIRREQEMREARRKVRAEVERWSKFYANSEKYFEVGRVVVGATDDESDVPKLCEAAEKARPRRSQLNKQKAEAGNNNGKPVLKPKNGKGDILQETQGEE